MTEITAKLIMDTISEWVSQKKQVSPEDWIKAAEKLNALESYEHDKLVELEQSVNILIRDAMASQEKRNVAAAEKEVKCSDKYAEYRRQELFIKRIDQTIALAKHHAKLISYGN